MNACDECLTAAYDEYPGATYDEQVTICTELGAEIGDHICEARESGEPCACECNISGCI